MLEPTDEQIAAFKAAWQAEDRYGKFDKPGDRTRAGLRAVFALDESEESECPRCGEPITSVTAMAHDLAQHR